MYSYDNTLHDEVTKMFLQALTIRPEDPDLHVSSRDIYNQQTTATTNKKK